MEQTRQTPRLGSEVIAFNARGAMLDITDSTLAVTHESQTCEGHCPSCGHYATFDFLGEQRWPPQVVEALGCPPVNYLWTCRECHTTISEIDIRP